MLNCPLREQDFSGLSVKTRSVFAPDFFTRPYGKILEKFKAVFNRKIRFEK